MAEHEQQAVKSLDTYGITGDYARRVLNTFRSSTVFDVTNQGVVAYKDQQAIQPNKRSV